METQHIKLNANTFKDQVSPRQQDQILKSHQQIMGAWACSSQGEWNSCYFEIKPDEKHFVIAVTHDLYRTSPTTSLLVIFTGKMLIEIAFTKELKSRKNIFATENFLLSCYFCRWK